jgi:hypothetical protein
VPAGEPFCKLVGMDWFKSKDRIDHIAGRPRSLVQVRLVLLRRSVSLWELEFFMKTILAMLVSSNNLKKSETVKRREINFYNLTLWLCGMNDVDHAEGVLKWRSLFLCHQFTGTEIFVPICDWFNNWNIPMVLVFPWLAKQNCCLSSIIPRIKVLLPVSRRV